MIEYFNQPAPFALDPAVTRLIAELAGEPAGVVFDAPSMQLYIKDPGNPANTYLSDAAGKLIYTSPGSKNIWNKDGVLEAGTALRCEYDRATGDALGIRLEEQRTNLVRRTVPTPLGSLQWASGAWETTRTRIGIFGGVAYSFLGDGVGSKNRVPTLGTPLAAGTVYCLSAVIEREDATAFAWGIYIGGSGFTSLAAFNWENSDIVRGAGVAPIASGIVELGTGPNGGRMVMVWATMTAAGDETVYVYPNGTGAVSASTVFHALQIEAGTSPSSLINCVGTQVTRAGDGVYLLPSMLPHNPASGVVAVEFTPSPGSDEAIAFALMSTSSYLYAANVAAVGANGSFEGRNDNAYQAQLKQQLGRKRMRISGFYAADDYRASFDGGPVVRDDTATVAQNMDRYHFGGFGSPWAAPLNGHVRRFKYLPRTAVTDDELRSMLP